MQFIIIDAGAMCQTDEEGNIISTGIVGQVERDNAAFMFTERVKNAAQDFADRIGHPVYVYAPAIAGGWMWNQIEPADR